MGVGELIINNIPGNLPEPIKEELNRILKLEKDNYGLVFAVRDSYETILKILLLSICYLVKENDEDGFCKTLFLKQMSFGDWISELPSELKKADYVLNHPQIHKYLKQLVKFYNLSNIVKWRNDFIGHGLMSDPEDEDFFKDAGAKINELIDFLTQYSIPQDILQLDFKNLVPFMFTEADEFFLYESVSSTGTVFYTNHNTRRRVIRSFRYFNEKRKKYTDALSVTMSHTLRGQNIYLSEDDKAVDGYHLAPFYKKPAYMEKWVSKILEENTKGIFLMKGGRGTGKSSFALACDELNQHGDQKIVLKSEGEEVSVRAYYCSRVDIGGINDFIPYLHDILNVLPDGRTIRSRQGTLPDYSASVVDTLAFYREQYETFLGREKLLLFIDGIDELTNKGWSILEKLPLKGDVPEGIYIILTCRAEKEEVPPVISDFIDRFDFNASIEFDIRKENHALMAEILTEKYQLPDKEAGEVATALDDRLSLLPLLLGQDRQEVFKLTTLPKDALSLETMLESYLKRMQLCYGKVYFKDFIKFVLTVTEATEGLTLGEISALSAGRNTTTRELCYLRDSAPLLVEYRSYRGNLFGISRAEYREYFRKQYLNVFRELVLEWKSQLEQFGGDVGKMDRVSADILLYLCSNLAEFTLAFQCDKELSIEKDKTEILYKINMICRAVSMADQVHRNRRALHGMTSVTRTIEQLVEMRVADQQLVDLYLDCMIDMTERAVDLREMKWIGEAVQRTKALIEENEELFCVNTEERRIKLAGFYGHGMICFCEEYDAEKAEEYCGKAIEALGDSCPQNDALKEKYGAVRKVLLHNYLGVNRNRKPAEILVQAEKFKMTVDNEMDSFSKASDYLMIAMCYKSAHRFEEAECLLRDSCDLMERILQERKIRPQALTDAGEEEIYSTAYWRMCQCVNERISIGTNAADFWELKIAIAIMDQFIQHMTDISQSGFGYFDMMRLNFMTTAALLRNSLAAKLSDSYLRKVIVEGRKLTIPDLKEESYRIVEMVWQCYQNLKRGGIAFNRIDAMFNLMNCSCVYAGFGEYERGMEFLKKIIGEYTPHNEQEEMVHRILEGKLQEMEKRNSHMHCIYSFCN